MNPSVRPRNDRSVGAGGAASRPPRWARWLLNHLHPDDTLEEVEGDLDELYAYWYEQHGFQKWISVGAVSHQRKVATHHVEQHAKQ